MCAMGISERDVRVKEEEEVLETVMTENFLNKYQIQNHRSKNLREC